MAAMVDHVAKALSRLPFQLQRDQSWIDTVTVLVTPFQRLEDTIAEMKLQRHIDDAVGAQLDRIGALVGQPRDGITDDTVYRRYIRARISANRSRGSINDLIKIASLVIDDPAATITVTNWGVAALEVMVEGVAVTTEVHDVLIGLMRRATLAGVRVIVQTSSDVPASMFTWFGIEPGEGFGGLLGATEPGTFTLPEGVAAWAGLCAFTFETVSMGFAPNATVDAAAGNPFTKAAMLAAVQFANDNEYLGSYVFAIVDGHVEITMVTGEGFIMLPVADPDCGDLCAYLGFGAGVTVPDQVPGYVYRAPNAMWGLAGLWDHATDD